VVVVVVMVAGTEDVGMVEEVVDELVPFVVETSTTDEHAVAISITNRQQ
jgi:hypothetical protein